MMNKNNIYISLELLLRNIKVSVISIDDKALDCA